MTPPKPLRLAIDLDALAVNYRWFERTAGVPVGAAVKANAYGLGAGRVAARLFEEGCRTFYVASWAEAAELDAIPEAARIVVLHGVDAADMPFAAQHRAEPMVCSLEQARLWAAGGNGRGCDLMIDTGMNRLGFDWRVFDANALGGVNVDTVHSHLACADVPRHALNPAQLARFERAAAGVGRRRAIAGSGGVGLGRDFTLDAVRPGLGLYGGIANAAMAGALVQVVRPEARVVQVRKVPAGDTAGYGATWTAGRESRLAVLNLGYADGYLTGFSNAGGCIVGGVRCPVAGRVSMDLLIVDVTDAPDVAPGDWLPLEFDLPTAAAQSGLTQYELLTGLGARYERIYL